MRVAHPVFQRLIGADDAAIQSSGQIAARSHFIEFLRAFVQNAKGRHAARQVLQFRPRYSFMAATVSSGALRFGQCPVARSLTSLLAERWRWTNSPAQSGAITSSEHWRIRAGVLTN